MSSLAPRVDRIQALTDNWIINGDMRISQRGDYSSATSAVDNAYYIDRFQSNVQGVTANIQHISTSQPTALSNSKSSKLIATSSASGF